MAELTNKPFKVSHKARWCPGCGNHAILSTVQIVLDQLGLLPHQVVFVSGIGCSGRFVYYLKSYGFHVIHGRAPAVATGIKLANPDLSVWVVTGDGDGLRIGGNHLFHLFRRNLDINVLLINNEIYGLTKGQYSPTSQPGTISVTSPHGSVERPVNPLSFAIASGATFVARALDVDTGNLQSVIKSAARHKGTSFVEILQSCPTFHAHVFEDLKNPLSRKEKTIWLTENEPMVFGHANEKALGMKEDEMAVYPSHLLDTHAIMTHRPTLPSPNRAFMLSQLRPPEFPLPMGVFRNVEFPCFEEELEKMAELEKTKQPQRTLETLFR